MLDRSPTAVLSWEASMHQSARSLVARFEGTDGNGWTQLVVPGFELSLTKSKFGETYDIDFVFLLTGDHRYDAAGEAKRLLVWLQSHRPWRTHALLAVVFNGAHILDVQRIARVTETGSQHQVAAGVIDLPSSTYSGFTGYGWLLDDTGLKSSPL
jgi:hypothetical protein